MGSSDGAGEFNTGSKPAIGWHAIQWVGGVATETGDELMGHVDRMQELPLFLGTR